MKQSKKSDTYTSIAIGAILVCVVINAVMQGDLASEFKKQIEKSTPARALERPFEELYNAMSSNGMAKEIGSYDDFCRIIKDKENQKFVYSFLTKKSIELTTPEYEAIKDADEFSTLLDERINEHEAALLVWQIKKEELLEKQSRSETLNSITLALVFLYIMWLILRLYSMSDSPSKIRRRESETVNYQNINNAELLAQALENKFVGRDNLVRRDSIVRVISGYLDHELRMLEEMEHVNDPMEQELNRIPIADKIDMYNTLLCRYRTVASDQPQEHSKDVTIVTENVVEAQCGNSTEHVAESFRIGAAIEQEYVENMTNGKIGLQELMQSDKNKQKNVAPVKKISHERKTMIIIISSFVGLFLGVGTGAAFFAIWSIGGKPLSGVMLVSGIVFGRLAYVGIFKYFYKEQYKMDQDGKKAEVDNFSSTRKGVAEYNIFFQVLLYLNIGVGVIRGLISHVYGYDLYVDIGQGHFAIQVLASVASIVGLILMIRKNKIGFYVYVSSCVVQAMLALADGEAPVGILYAILIILLLKRVKNKGVSGWDILFAKK